MAVYLWNKFNLSLLLLDSNSTQLILMNVTVLFLCVQACGGSCVCVCGGGCFRLLPQGEKRLLWMNSLFLHRFVPRLAEKPRSQSEHGAYSELSISLQAEPCSRYRHANADPPPVAAPLPAAHFHLFSNDSLYLLTSTASTCQSPLVSHKSFRVTSDHSVGCPGRLRGTVCKPIRLLQLTHACWDLAAPIKDVGILVTSRADKTSDRCDL